MSIRHRSSHRAMQVALAISIVAVAMPEAEAIGLGGGTSAPSSQITMGTNVVPVTGYCGGGYSQGQVATPQNINTLAGQVSQDSTWLGTIVAQGSQQVTNQLRMNMQAQANLMTAQDRQLVAAVKQRMGTGYQNAYDACTAAANNLCTANAAGGHINGPVAAAAANAAAPVMVGAILNGGAPGGVAPNTAATGAGANANSYAYNAGRKFPSTTAAVQAITTAPAKEFAAEDSLLPSVKTSGGAGLQQMAHFVAHLTNPRPAPALPSNQTDSATGKAYQAMQREENADLSLAQAALTSVGTYNVPNISITAAGATADAAGVSGLANNFSFKKKIAAMAAANGTPNHISSDQFLNAYAGSFFFNKDFYTQVTTNIANNPTSYHQYMLFLASANLQMNYRIMRAMEYTEANVAAIQSLKTRQLFEARLAALRRAAMSGQANN